MTTLQEHIDSIDASFTNTRDYDDTQSMMLVDGTLVCVLRGCDIFRKAGDGRWDRRSHAGPQPLTGKIARLTQGQVNEAALQVDMNRFKLSRAEEVIAHCESVIDIVRVAMEDVAVVADESRKALGMPPKAPQHSGKYTPNEAVMAVYSDMVIELEIVIHKHLA